VREDIVFVETLPRDDGRFDIVITPLANRSFPLLRYVMEDATARTLDKPARGFACLSEISGRCGDVIVAGDGSLIHPARIDVIFESDGFGAQIHAYRVHQESDGAITVWVEPSAGQAPSPAELRAQFERLVGSRMVDIRVVERLPPANQKHRIVTSQISPAGS